MKKNSDNKYCQLAFFVFMNIFKGNICLLLFALLAVGCAKQGMPTGGQKDVTPPQTRSITPPNGSLNSQSQEFYIEFDEYVVLKDAENNVLVSPPMKERPEIKTKGKGIKVTIKDSLQPNTTYLFQFKEAIADFTEGNLLPSVEYVFSTGNYLDSMMLNGKVVEALSMVADKDIVNVWLMDEERYRQAVDALNDTNVKAPQPNYSTRTDKGGLFCFNNIKPGRYHIVAVKDEDKNGIVGATETVAFIDTTTAAMMMPTKLDNADTAVGQQVADSALQKPKTIIQNSPTLRLSTPIMERQRLTSSKFNAAGKVVVTSILPLQSPQIFAGIEQAVWRLNSNRDTLTLWTLRKECDSLQLIVIDPSGINDTLELRWLGNNKPKKGGLQKPAPKVKEMQLSATTLHYYDSLALLFATPLDTARCRLDSVAIITLLKDSSIECCNASIDSSGMKVKLLYHFRQGEKYSVNVVKGRFTSIHDSESDSLQSVVTVTKAEDYGNLSLSVKGIGDMIVELLDESGKVLRDKRITGNDMVKFHNLKPMKYRIRVISDSNANGKWDGGNFASQTQPEQVLYLDKTLDIRANWDFEEEITVEQ